MTRLPAEQTVEAGEIVRQAVIVRTDAGSEPAHGPPSRWLMRMGGGAKWGAGRLRTIRTNLSKDEAKSSSICDDSRKIVQISLLEGARPWQVYHRWSVP